MFLHYYLFFKHEIPLLCLPAGDQEQEDRLQQAKPVFMFPHLYNCLLPTVSLSQAVRNTNKLTGYSVAFVVYSQIV